MIWLTKKLQREQTGFTLVELLVVVAILAILVAVVTPNFTGLIGRGELQTYNAEKKTVQSIIDAYLADHRKSAMTASTFKHAAIPAGHLCATCTDATGAKIETFFRQAVKWCWAIATTGLVTNSQDGVACGAGPPPIPTGGT